MELYDSTRSDRTQLDDELRQKAHESTEDADRAKDKAGDKAEDGKEELSKVGHDPGGFIVTAIIGIVGALLGGFLAAALFDAHPLDAFFDISTWITAIVGSVILLLIYRLVANRGGRTLHT